MKKRILIANYNMIIGGSTTALIGLLNSIDKTKYEVDLILYKNEGELLSMIPSGVNLLPEAYTCGGKFGKIKKVIIGCLSGYLFKAAYVNRINGQMGYSQQVLYDFQVRCLSRRMEKEYDIAIGFLEGWAVRYIAHRVSAAKRIGWLHSTFSKIGVFPKLELVWMNRVDLIACVAKRCLDDFLVAMPEMKHKAIYVPNITDAEFIRTMAKIEVTKDRHFTYFKEFDGFKIISVCRLSIETKGLDRAVNAARILKCKGFRFLWCIVGGGEDAERLKSMISEYGVEDYVILTGSRINPYPFLNAADILCMPSRWEGMPCTVEEAKTLGVPAIVTEYLSANEQLKNGLEGIIVANNDDSIVDALQLCMEDRSIISKMKEYMFSNEGRNVYDADVVQRIVS